MPTHRKLDTAPDFRLGRTLDEATAEFDGAQAFRRFCRPALSRHRSADHDVLVERARFHLGAARTRQIATSVGAIQTYEFLPEGSPLASVLLVHGWTGEAAFMGAFADYFRRRGFRAVLLDLPAHGRSSGAESNLMDCSRAVLDIAETMGPMRFALGHSIGGLAVLTAAEGRRPMPRSYPFEACVLVSTPDRFGAMTRNFAAEQGLSAPGLRAFEARLETLAGRRIADYNGSDMLAAVGRPALVLHAPDDTEVPFADAERLTRASKAAELQAFAGAGHSAILYHPQAVRAAAAFLTRQVVG